MDIWQLDEKSASVWTDQAIKNEGIITKSHQTIPVEDILKLLPREHETFPIGELSDGQRVFHPDWGAGVVDGRIQAEGEKLVGIRLNQLLSTRGKVYFPEKTPIPVYWRDIPLMAQFYNPA